MLMARQLSVSQSLTKKERTGYSKTMTPRLSTVISMSLLVYLPWLISILVPNVLTLATLACNNYVQMVHREIQIASSYVSHICADVVNMQLCVTGTECSHTNQRHHQWSKTPYTAHAQSYHGISGYSTHEYSYNSNLFMNIFNEPHWNEMMKGSRS